MRLAKLLLLVILSSAATACWAQIQPEEPIAAASTERDLAKSIHIYPNPTLPATEFVYVKTDEMPAHSVKLTLHNILGNQMEVETEVVDDHELRVRVKELAVGYYLIAVKDDKSKFRGTFKFLKR